MTGEIQLSSSAAWTSNYASKLIDVIIDVIKKRKRAPDPGPGARL